MAKHIEIGVAGEKYAAEYLKSKGYKIHFQNWRSSRLEVDIIASFDNQWVFVEVKTRGGTRFGNPEDFVNEKKRSLLRKAAEIFLWENVEFPTLRFDIISIVANCEIMHEIEHFEDAFY